MSHEVTAIYQDTAAAQIAIDRILAKGVETRDISVLMSDTSGGKRFAVETGSKAAEGTATGGIAGGALGGIAASLVAIGAIAAPGVGVIAAGPLVAGLSGAGAGAAAGGLLGALIGYGIPEHEAKLYSDAVGDGSVLLGVTVDDERTGDIREILERTGGEHIRD